MRFEVTSDSKGLISS